MRCIGYRRNRYSGVYTLVKNLEDTRECSRSGSGGGGGGGSSK